MAYKAPIWEDGKSPAISAENLNNLSQAAEGAQVLYGNSAPTSSTEGAVGQFYLVVVADSDGNYPLYQCVAIANGSYTWIDTRRIPDSITSMLGISAPGTINRALNVLANVGNLHVWDKETISYSVKNVTQSVNILLAPKTSYQYADSVVGGPNGTELVNPKTFTTPSAHGGISVLNNKYVKVDGKVYLWPGASNASSSGWSYACDEIVTVTTIAHTDYLTSTDRNAYTDGTVGNTAITYLGQLGGGARIEVGSYVGTGTAGSKNKTSIPISKWTKIVIVQAASPDKIAGNGYFWMLCIRGNTNSTLSFPSTNNLIKYTNTLTWQEETLSWYNNNDYDDPTLQLNESGVTYIYVSIG